MEKNYRVVGVSGSLRQASLNTLYLRALAECCPSQVSFKIYDELGHIPPFNVDEDDAPPRAVMNWKAFLEPADLIIIASPEYAHGLSGVLKNALDWLVSSYQLIDRPIALPNISVRATHAHTHMEEVIRTMGFEMAQKCCLKATHDSPLVNIDFGLEEMLLDNQIRRRLDEFWDKAIDFLSAKNRD